MGIERCGRIPRKSWRPGGDGLQMMLWFGRPQGAFGIVKTSILLSSSSSLHKCIEENVNKGGGWVGWGSSCGAGVGEGVGCGDIGVGWGSSSSLSLHINSSSSSLQPQKIQSPASPPRHLQPMKIQPPSSSAKQNPIFPLFTYTGQRES
ncbi:unnamed protein product [Prunus armeniaca]|uniref:Uncharacterized protein n=1 Tax=Prunus armeniaca TaxID=36596 RepID=A0A6J5W5Q7_PRUAR|nr:unnamed protein product [Prunus armeniaca]